MRRALLIMVLGLAGVPAVAAAQLPPLPDPPAVTTPTVPMPVPVPTPTLPAPPPAPTPALPAPTASVPPAPSAPSPPSTPSVPGSPVGSSSGSSGPSGSSGSSGSPGGGTSGSTSPGRGSTDDGTPRGENRAARRPTVAIRFRVARAGRVRIPLLQIAPVCRSAGRLLVDATRGANRLRFDGRPGGKRLPDGTYVARTPSGPVRFALVDGRPTRRPDRLAESVCPSSFALADRGAAAEAAAGADTTPPGAETPAPGAAGPEPSRSLPEVLGTSLTEAAEAAASLHPAFYLLLGLAIVALAAATLPAKAMPVAAAGATLARRRAELTLAGTVALLTVVVAYWLTLV